MNETDIGAQLTVLAVDDEKPALDELAFLLRAQETVAHVHTASDATTALRILRDGGIDGVFLDINMPGLDGLELAGILSNFATPPPVVFVTAHDDRAVAAFDLGAVDYLLKPLREERLAQAVRRIVGLAGRNQAGAKVDAAPSDEVIPVELGGVTTLVQRSAVEWVEADGDYARLHTAGKSHLVRIPISTLESRWAEAGFLRVHRSYLVSLALVTGIRTVGSGLVVTLRPHSGKPPVELPVSRRHTRELKDRLVRTPQAELVVAVSGHTDPPARERVVLAQRHGARIVRTRVEVEEQTEVGDAMIRGLVRAQLGLAIRLTVVVAGSLCAIPLLTMLFPALSDYSVWGIRLAWLVMGAVLPLLLITGWVFVRRAERNEQDFTNLVDD